jgi:ribosomal protein L11 methyltransferase
MWRELGFVVSRDTVERWCDALLEAGALSVLAEDANAETTDEEALFGEPGMPAPSAPGWRQTRMTVLMPARDDATALIEAAAATLGEATPVAMVSREVDDQDWVRLSQSQFEPIPIGQRLLITPSWRRESRPSPDEGASDRIEIVLDPGLAFGTGSHPTTRLCLGWLEAHLCPDDTLIDYGCGSGILAIAAARLGAANVVGIDIDPQALASSYGNAVLNGVSLDLRPSTAPAPSPADVVIANILATPLKLLAPLLQSLVKPGGALVLAGLLARQVDEVATCYTDVHLTPFAVEDGWACLAGRKTG